MRKLIAFTLGLSLFFIMACQKDQIEPPKNQSVPPFLSFGFGDNYGNIDTVGNYKIAVEQSVHLAYLNLDSLLATYGDDADFNWTLSNDSSFVGENPEISVAEPGDYQLKLEITDKDGKSHLVGQRNFSAYDRQFLSLTIAEHWGWYGVYLFNNISWPDTKKADVYLRVLAYDNDVDEANGRNPKIVFKSAVLKGVSPSQNKTLTIMPQSDASMPFPFDISNKHNYVYQLMVIDENGKEYIWITTRAYGLASGPYQESLYENGSIRNGEIHFGADADVSIYFTLNTN